MAEEVSRRSIVYEITTDFGKSKMTTKEAIDQFAKFGDEIEKDTTKAKTLTTQLRNMRNELSKLDEGTAEFQNLAIAAAKLEDKIGDVRQRVRNLASDTKNLDAFVSIATGIAGGFAVAQGAAALFGKENKKLQETLLKVQASLAILNGLQQVQATLMNESAARTFIVTNAQKAYTFVTQGATLATRAFNAALIATGAGAVLAALGLIIAYWNDIKEAIIGADDAQKAFNDEMDKVGEELKAKKLKEREQALQDELAVLEAAVIQAKQGSKEQLDAQKELLKRKYEVTIKTEQLTNAQLYLLRVKLNAELEKLDIEFRKKQKQRAEDTLGEIVEMERAALIDTQFAFAAQKELEARIKAENEKQGLIAKTAEVQGTAHEQLMRELDEEAEQRSRLGEIAQQSAVIFNNLANLARDNSDAQLALSIASVIAANAEALAKGVASAASIPFPANLPAIFSTIATITGVFASIKNMSEQARAAQASARTQTAQRFAEGTPYVELKGNPDGVDTIPARLTKGERIVPVEENIKYWDVLEAIRNNNLNDFIDINYVSPALAAKTIEEIERDSALDYSNRFYKQLLATAEGNQINKKALKYLNSIDVKLGKSIPSRYA